MDFEPMDDFEQELQQAFERRPAPLGLKRKIMERRRESAQRGRFAWLRLMPSLVSVSLCILAALAIYGGYQHRRAEQEQKSLAARRQLLTALRITNHALEHTNRQLAAHHHNRQD